MSTSNKAVPGEPNTKISICRLCALVSGSKSFIPLYMNKEPQVTTKELNQLVPNVVSLDDGLPQEACFKCVENVSKCFKFINTVMDTQEKLRHMMRISETKLNDASPNQFFENEQWSMAVDEDNELRTPNTCAPKGSSKPGKGLASSQKTATKTPPTKRPINRAESSSSSVSSRSNASATDTYMNRLSSCTFKPVSVATDTPTLSPKKLFRCGVCFEKFAEKEICLSHIAQQHAGVQKPVQPNTIFETIRAGAAAADSAKPAVPPSSAAGRTSNAASNKSVSATNLLTNGEATASRNKPDSVDGESQPPPKRPGTTRRKVLAIDSFYLEVKKRCTRYVCDNCGRMMMSRFAFLRHLHEHRQLPKPEPVVARERPRKRPGSQSDGRYCNVCKKSVQDGMRHRMYHTIVTLESQFPSSATMLANLT